MYSGPTLGLGMAYQSWWPISKDLPQTMNPGRFCLSFNTLATRHLDPREGRGAQCNPSCPFRSSSPHSTGPIALEVNFRAPGLTKDCRLNFQGPEVAEGPVRQENIL